MLLYIHILFPKREKRKPHEAITNDACCILVCGSAERKENSEPNVPDHLSNM